MRRTIEAYVISNYYSFLTPIAKVSESSSKISAKGLACVKGTAAFWHF